MIQSGQNVVAIDKVVKQVQNLVVSHMKSLGNRRFQITSDLSFCLVRELILSGVVDMPVIKQAIL